MFICSHYVVRKFVEAVALRSRVGEVFDGIVLSHGRTSAKVQLHDPAVVATVRSKPAVGSTVDLRLDGVDTGARRVEFTVIDET